MRTFLKKYMVGGRVLKTALAVTLAIFLTDLLGMDRVTLAAIVALLTVQRTFYHSLLQSAAKLGSVLLGGVVGTAFSYIIGPTPLGYGLVTLVAIYACLRLHWQDHIVLTAVTAITVVFSGSDVPYTFSLEQIATAMLGAISALGINFLFTPNHRKDVLEKLEQADERIRKLLDFIMLEMLEPGCDDRGFKQEAKELESFIEEGFEAAKLLREEQKFVINRETDSDIYRQTFRIYSSQLSRLVEMHQLARRMPIKVPHAAPLVQLFRVVQKTQERRVKGRSDHFRQVDRLMEKMENSFAYLDLPQSREEFVSRASLFHLFQEIKRYYNRLQKIPYAVLPGKR